jgi:hypothetical protein
MFIINSKRENKKSIFYFLLITIIISYQFYLLDNLNKDYIIIFIDFIIKLIFLKGIISDLKNLIYLPVNYRIKKYVLFLLPILTMINIPSLFFLFNLKFFLFFILLLNSYIVFNLKIQFEQSLIFSLSIYIVIYLIYKYQPPFLLSLMCFLTITFFLYKNSCRILKLT